jgi:hypothetical protein
MAIDQSSNGSHDDAALRRAYHAAAAEEPSATLDARILADAHRAVDRSRSSSGFARRWAVPVSIAATVVVTAGIVLRLSEQDSSTTQSPPSATLRSATQASPTAEARRATPPADARTGAPASTSDSASKETSAAAPMQERALEDAARARREKFSTAAASASAPGTNADVIAVRASGQPGAYEFDVTIRSPDSGCGQYADWWEVVSTEGKLLYRRVLLHSHADEQPFARSGGPVPMQRDTAVWVRAHMNPGGYGGKAFFGSIATGFVPKTLAPDFAATLAQQPPLPDGCAF